MKSAQRWKAMVEAEHAQSDGMRWELPPSDHWLKSAERFKADPRRTDDLLVDRLLEHVESHQTVLDVGGGAGRLTLPLALRCRHVTVVEPSPGMASALLQQTEEYGIHNVSLVRSRWEDAEVERADVAMSAHVLYVVRDVELFLRKLESHAADRVIIVVYKAHPMAQVYPLWKRIHGEERLPMPCLPQLEEVLVELGVAYHVEMLPSHASGGFESKQQALEQLSERLYLPPNSEKRSALAEMLPEILEERDGTFAIRDAPTMEPALVWWKPET